MTTVSPTAEVGAASRVVDRVKWLAPTGELAWWGWIAPVFFPLLLLLIARVVGLRTEHVVLCSLFLFLSLMGARGRRFVLMGAPMWLTGVAYDFLRLVTYLRPPVHVADLWTAEHDLFGRIPEWIAGHTHPALDVATGAVYILYLPFPMVLAAILFFRDYPVGQRLSIAFGLTSLLGWAVWLAWPAAPPWYVDLHGLGPAQMDALPSAAGGLRFDAVLGVGLFRTFYSHSHNVFGAMPSLHVSYGLLPALATWQGRRRHPWLLTGCVAWALGMAYSAVYLRHHYILDVLAGTVVALAGWGLLRSAEAAWNHWPAYGRARATEVTS